jgi:hypothetical protein
VERAWLQGAGLELRQRDVHCINREAESTESEGDTDDQGDGAPLQMTSGGFQPPTDLSPPRMFLTIADLAIVPMLPRASHSEEPTRAKGWKLVSLF